MTRFGVCWAALANTATITMASVSKRYYSGKKDHHKRVTTESTDGHRKGELKRGS
jgi:hypothetical protein